MLGGLIEKDGSLLISRVTRIDVSDSRVSVEFVGATPKSDSKPEKPVTREQLLRELLPGAVLPERPSR